MYEKLITLKSRHIEMSDVLCCGFVTEWILISFFLKAFNLLA